MKRQLGIAEGTHGRGALEGWGAHVLGVKSCWGPSDSAKDPGQTGRGVPPIRSPGCSWTRDDSASLADSQK
ncbi:hypothetical protein NL676_034443 [Syzygium grande]|nr:hypothetical protein NL676_034443 [Syzygium grande]